MLNNLLSNAIKYSHPKGRIQVSLFTAAGYVNISVRDHGVGIPKEEQENIFEPFHKTRDEGTAGEKSTGLGLAIVRRIVTGHHGKIWLESASNQGSTFTFSLPLDLSL